MSADSVKGDDSGLFAARVVLYDPAISSMNLGDHIISDSARKHLSPLLEQAYVVDVSTHLPASAYLRHLRGADERFVLGSNLLRGRMNRLFRQWDIHLGNSQWVGPAVLMGVGWWQYGDEANRYTKTLYRRVLSQTRIHSARDSYTAERLRNLGHSVLMTGCPTLWNLTPDHCAAIATEQSSTVVATLTDYNRNPEADRELLKLLLSRYETVKYWLQGYRDLEYLRSLGTLADRIQLVAPNLAAYDDALTGDVDYIGTRLHAGIRALQHGRRSLILAIDNRAVEKQADFHIPVVQRGDHAEVDRWITRSDEVRVSLPTAAIREWKQQFGLVD